LEGSGDFFLSLLQLITASFSKSVSEDCLDLWATYVTDQVLLDPSNAELVANEDVEGLNFKADKYVGPSSSRVSTPTYGTGLRTTKMKVVRGMMV